MCQKCNKKYGTSPSHNMRKINYICQSCDKSGCGYMNFGILLCSSCQKRLESVTKILKYNALLFCINDKSTNCHHELCNKCFFDTLTTLSANSLIKTRQILSLDYSFTFLQWDSKTYEKFTQQFTYRNQKTHSETKSDKEKAEDYDTIWDLCDSMGNVLSKLEQDLMDPEKNTLSIALYIGIIFNLRSGLGMYRDKKNYKEEDKEEDHLGTFTLNVDNIKVSNDNHINLAFI